MKKKDNIKFTLEAELARRMAGDVYPELLRLMERNSVNAITVQSVNRDAKRHEPDDRFIITTEEIIDCRKRKTANQIALEALMDNDDVDGYITDDIAFEYVEHDVVYGYPGEAEDEGDEGEASDDNKMKIVNVSICPVWKHDSSIDYVFYCELVVNAIESLRKREDRINELIQKMDRIPVTRSVIIEKICNGRK